MGTVNVLERCAARPGVRAVVIVTSDKCYENDEQATAYREDDPSAATIPTAAARAAPSW